MRALLRRLLHLDRRATFVIVAVAVVAPFLAPFGLPVRPTDPVRQAFAAVDSLRGGGKPMLLSYDFEPGAEAELGPAARAILAHAFSNGTPVVVVNFMPAGLGLAENDLEAVAARYGKVNGRDYVFLGYNPSVLNSLLMIGKEIRDAFPTDSGGTPVDEIPLMRGIHSYDDFGLVVDLSSSYQPDYFVRYAVGRFGARLVIGATAVLASDYYPYLHAGQSEGLIGGMKGAAEYEQLLVDAGILAGLAEGGQGMDSQSAAHVAIVALIVLGNLAYLLGGRGRRAGRGA